MRRSRGVETRDQISADLLQMSKDARESIRKVNRISKKLEDSKNSDDHDDTDFSLRGIALDRARKFKLAEEYGIENKTSKNNTSKKKIIKSRSNESHLENLGKKVDETQNRLRSLYSRGQFQGCRVRPLLREFQELESSKPGFISIEDFRDILKARLNLPLSKSEADVLCEWFSSSSSSSSVRYIEFVLWCEPWTTWGTSKREHDEIKSKKYSSKRSRLRGTYTNRFVVSTGLACIHEIVQTRSDELRKRRRERNKMSRTEDANDVLKRLGLYVDRFDSLDGFLERSSIRTLKKRMEDIFEDHGLAARSGTKKNDAHLMDSDELLTFLNDVHDAILRVLHQNQDQNKQEATTQEIIGNRLIKNGTKIEYRFPASSRWFRGEVKQFHSNDTYVVFQLSVFISM